ncbi:MAG: hypothetical protein IJ748_05280 [Bacteroidales bacterium]|nr:hypothetical protein [Bacteroidales bacterium]
MLCMLPNLVLAQEDIIVFHNAENLFYPVDDKETLDDDFTLEGKKRWSFKKYNKKLNDLAKTYIAVDEKQMPSLIGMCEIEGKEVLNALTMNTPLRKTGYKFIHYTSKDIRGIDVAFLYNPKRFKPEEDYVLPPVSDKEEDRTRDVLYVRGLLGKMRLNIYVLHAPSRRENNIKKDLRQQIFANVHQHIKDLAAKGEKNFLIMGDFNDNPWDETVKNTFGTEKTNCSVQLLNLMANNKKIAGSYVYSGDYLSFDQFIISENLKSQIIYEKSFDNTHVFKPLFLIDKDRYSKVDKPFSTYKGMKYQGGISDHFPIIMKLRTE